ncbi:hypothetical protein BD414DRAFT_547249 [Trametes punicea]|nr:hypothetical protein BD414DRAFT_547249 [Trametes punicea]
MQFKPAFAVFVVTAVLSSAAAIPLPGHNVVSDRGADVVSTKGVVQPGLNLPVRGRSPVRVLGRDPRHGSGSRGRSGSRSANLRAIEARRHGSGSRGRSASRLSRPRRQSGPPQREQPLNNYSSSKLVAMIQAPAAEVTAGAVAACSRSAAMAPALGAVTAAGPPESPHNLQPAVTVQAPAAEVTVGDAAAISKLASMGLDPVIGATVTPVGIPMAEAGVVRAMSEISRLDATALALVEETTVADVVMWLAATDPTLVAAVIAAAAGIWRPAVTGQALAAVETAALAPEEIEVAKLLRRLKPWRPKFLFLLSTIEGGRACSDGHVVLCFNGLDGSWNH